MPDLSRIYTSYRSTLNGLVSAAIAVILAVAALPAGLRRWVYVLAGLRAVGGMLSKDAGVTEAVLLSGDVQTVPSHEQPNDPSAKPVVRQ